MLNEDVSFIVADDDPDDRMLMEEAFIEAKIPNKITFTRDGVELLEHLRSQTYAKNKSPRQIVLLDLNMPRMDGREALREIKNDPNLRHIPVIILTTSDAEEDIFQTYDKGANSYIRKPVTFDGLTEMMEKIKRHWLDSARVP